MEAGVVQSYQHYNSIISEGKRVRRMRRTELSSQKIKSNSRNRRADIYFNTDRSKQVSKERSIPKVQPRKHTDHTHKNQANFYRVHREYYTEIQPANLSKEQSQNNSRKDGKIQFNRVNQINTSRQSSRDIVNKSNAENNNSFVKALRQSNQQMLSINNHVNSSKMYNQQANTSIKKSLVNNSNNVNQNRLKDQVVNVQINNNELKIPSKLSVNKSRVDEGSIKKSHDGLNSSHNKNDDYGIKQSKNNKMSHMSLQERASIHRSKMIQQNSKLLQQNIYLASQIKEKQNQNNNSARKSSASESKQPSQIFSKELSNLNQAQNSNFSKIKIENLMQNGNPIVNGSSAKRQSWKQAIQSLRELNDHKPNESIDKSINEQKNIHNVNSNTSSKANGFFDSKKMSLRIDSMRQDNIDSSQKNSWRHLPLASKQPSQRRSSIESMGSKIQPGSLKSVIENIQIHEYLVSLLNDFKQTTLKLNQGEHDTQLLCFLLQRKHFLQKANMIKSLKGGKNVFKLSTIEIPNQVLKQYLENEEIIKFAKELQLQKRQLFKSLEKSYHELKPQLKNNPYFKLETPNDNFSKEIVRILNEQLQQLYKNLKNSDSEKSQQSTENRIFEVMEIIFLISDLNGQQVKKFNFFDQIKDFEKYYNQYESDLIATVQYFASLK